MGFSAIIAANSGGNDGSEEVAPQVPGVFRLRYFPDRGLCDYFPASSMGRLQALLLQLLDLRDNQPGDLLHGHP